MIACQNAGRDQGKLPIHAALLLATNQLPAQCSSTHHLSTPSPSLDLHFLTWACVLATRFHKAVGSRASFPHTCSSPGILLVQIKKTFGNGCADILTCLSRSSWEDARYLSASFFSIALDRLIKGTNESMECKMPR